MQKENTFHPLPKKKNQNQKQKLKNNTTKKPQNLE